MKSGEHIRPQGTPSDYRSLPEAAEYLGWHYNTVLVRVRKGQIPVRWWGGRKWIAEEDLRHLPRRQRRYEEERDEKD